MTDGERLAVIEEIVAETRDRLFGNGKPGIIDKHDSRLNYLERFMWIVLGIVVADGGAHIVGALFK